MSEAGGQAEPSMEEILASIRKIISEDDEGEPTAAAAEEEPLELEEEAVDEIELVDEAEEEIELVEEIEEEEPLELEEEVEEAGDEVEFYEEPEEVEAAPPPPPPPPPLEPVDSLVGDQPRQQAATSLANLSTAITQHRPGLTVEQLAEDLLRPMLREWLDANLPDMVERLVQKEIQRMADQAEPK
jgi:uncharacterized protein